MRASLAALTLALAFVPARALACVTCGAGDPTLTVMGAEPPLAGRVRASLGVATLWDRVGETRLVEGRADLSISYAPADWVTLSATLPPLLRDLRDAQRARYTTLGPGDGEVRARFLWLRDRAFAPSHVFGPSVGLRVPTSLDHADARGLLPVDAQSGAGALAPLLGLQYGHFADPWALFASATVSLPFAGRYADTPGPSLSTTVAGQYRFDRAFTLRAAIDTRPKLRWSLRRVLVGDRMGLLLLISPPGYGKTTLMEYIASQLGLVFVKVNGPSLGHAVTSIDPAEAPNATARQEVDKINLALEMGNNVMLYLDDIQHTHPELLQKFISLCDGQRRIEGVWNGETRTYDLRGKRFCVIMAGNPYTESGDKFQIPDMLANRADTYNLGDILEGKGEQFALSYVENALTSNPTLGPIATRSLDDVHRFVKMAQGSGDEVASSAFEHDWSAVESQEAVSVLQKLLQVQAVLSRVNAEYIRSASMEDDYRTEPPFKLQGSYRNMNKLAEKVVSAMNDEELERLLDDHYRGESQTLTTGAEQNLLKLAEMRGRLSAEQKARWDEIKREYKRLKTMGGGEDDPVTRVTGTLSGLGRQLDEINRSIRDVAERIVPDADYELE